MNRNQIVIFVWKKVVVFARNLSLLKKSYKGNNLVLKTKKFCCEQFLTVEKIQAIWLFNQFTDFFSIKKKNWYWSKIFYRKRIMAKKIPPHSVKAVTTELCLQIPKGYYGKIYPRSSLVWYNFVIVDDGVIEWWSHWIWLLWDSYDFNDKSQWPGVRGWHRSKVCANCFAKKWGSNFYKNYWNRRYWKRYGRLQIDRSLLIFYFI